MTATTRGNSVVAALLVLGGVAFVGLAIFYATQDTSFLASPLARHYKHAVACAVAAVCAFVAANFMRPRSAA